MTRTRNIYFIRHGETTANVKRITQSPDTALTDRGQEQTKSLALRLSHLNIKHIVSSPYVRTIQTADAIADMYTINVVATDLLREWDSPSNLFGIRADDPMVISAKTHIRDNWGTDWRYHDEETCQELLQRVQDLLYYIQTETNDDIVLVSHGKFLFFVFTYLLTQSLDPQMYQHVMDPALVLDNTSISHVTVSPDGQFTIHTIGDSTHLS